MATISQVSPPRARAGDTLAITGAGFGTAGGSVTVDGIAAVLSLQTDTALTITVPGGIRTDRSVLLVVTAEDATTVSRAWHSKATKAELKTFLMAFQKPGDLEDWGTSTAAEHETDIEAKDIEDMHELAQYIPRDLLVSAGDMVGRNANGVGRVAGGAVGSTVMLDRNANAGISHRTRQPGLLTWGIQIQDIIPIFTAMTGHGDAKQGTSRGTELRAPNGGKAGILSVYVDEQSGTRNIDRIQLAKNGTTVYDSGTGLGLLAQQVHVRNVFDDVGDVATTDRFSVFLTADNGTGTVDCIAMLGIF